MSNVLSLEALLDIQTPSPLQCIEIAPKQSVYCKRDDLLHPIISGNKWRKLKPILERAVASDVKHIGSFGGAYSNHLHALGFACTRLGIKFTAIVRAHPQSPLTPTLKDLNKWGASLKFVSREEYQLKTKHCYLTQIQQTFNIEMLIPEGGATASSLGGIACMMEEIHIQHPQAFDLILLPVASGATMAGIIHYIQKHQLQTKVLGVAVLKGQGYLEELVINLVQSHLNDDNPGVAEFNYRPCTDQHTPPKYQYRVNWEIIHRSDFHASGYAKTNALQLAFRQQFFVQHGFTLDKVYNTKSFFALNQLLSEKSLDHFTHKMILHTGGLQGDRANFD